MNPTDHQLQTLFRDSTNALSPEVATLVAGGIARGRRQRSRRRAGSALAAVAVFGVIGSVAGADLLGDSKQGAGFATNEPELPAPAEPTVVKPPERRELAVTAEGIPDRFAELFPGSIEEVAQKPLDDANPIVEFRWNGYAVRVALTTEQYVSGGLVGTPMERCRLEGGMSGRCVTGPNGAAITSMTWTGPPADGGVTSSALSVFTADGWTVTVMAHNAADSKDSQVLSERPPFSLHELRRAATSEVWFE